MSKINDPLKGSDSAVEMARLRSAFNLAVIGLSIAAALVVILVLDGVRDAKDITSIVGLFTSVLGTLVGAFFGLQIGSADKQKTEKRAADAERKWNAVLAAADPGGIVAAARSIDPEAFK